MKETTQILHQGDTPEEYYGAINPPVVHASLFGYKTYQDFLEAQADMYHRPFYNRDFNPTVALVVDGKIAAEGLATPVGPSSRVNVLPAFGGG